MALMRRFRFHKLVEIFRIPAFNYALLAFGVLWFGVVIILALSGKNGAFDIEPSAVHHDSGCSYVTMVPHTPKYRFFLEYAPDTLADSTASKLVLLENGVAIGRPHVLHDHIRTEGEGRYSHWYGGLFFSAPDCTDPRNSGRRYSILVEPSLRTWVKASLIASLAFVHFALTGLFGKRLFYVHGTLMLRDLMISLSLPKSLRTRRGLGLLGMVLLVALGAVVFLIFSWYSGRSVELSTGSAYQFSDAYGYWVCANELINDHLMEAQNWREWCQRRIIYPAFLSAIARFSNQNIHLTLIAQSALLSLSLTILAFRVATIAGVLGGAFALALLFYFSTFDAFALTMTENAGLMFGALALSSLILASQRQSLYWISIGLALLSISLNARAGAFFVLPMLLIWVGVVATIWHKPVLRWLLAAGIAMTSGFALQMLLVMLGGGVPTGSHSSFAYTLYGLSVGGLGWGRVLTDHPYLSTLGSDAAMGQEIYRLALANITHDPARFLEGLYKGWRVFVAEGTYGYQRVGSMAPALRVLWWVGGAYLVLRWRDPRCLLLLAFTIGTLLSVPFLRADGGPRVFAATIPADVLQIVIGAWCLIMPLLLGLRTFWQNYRDGGLPVEARRVFAPESFAAVLFGLVFLVVLLPVREPENTTQRSALSCSGDDFPVAARIGYGGTYLLDLVEKADPNPFKGEVVRSAFVQGIPHDAWWWSPRPPDTLRSLLTVYQAATPMDNYSVWNVYSERNLSAYFGKDVGLCVSRHDTIIVFGIPYRKLNVIKVL